MISTVITGCRTGIGLELVKQLSRVDNTLVIATYRDITKAHELKELADKNKNIKLLNLDVTAFGTFDKFVEDVKNIVGDEGLSSIIHNAGILTVSKTARIEDVQAKDLIDMYTTNTVAPIMLTKALLPLIKAKAQMKSTLPIGLEKGAIFFISSNLGSHQLNNCECYWGYKESKSALNMAMLTLKVELAKFGIGTMSIHPGWVKTNMGGNNAPIEPQESVQGMIKLITNFSAKTNGTYYKYDGQIIPW